MGVRKQTILYFLLALSFLSLTVVVGKARHASFSNMDEEIRTVDLCQIIYSPHQYEGMVIRTEATYAITFEGETLYKTSCSSREKAVGVRFDCDKAVVCKELKDKLRKNIQGKFL